MAETRYIVTYPDKIREAIHKSVVTALNSKFPIVAGDFKVSVANLRVKYDAMSHNEQKKVLLARGNASDVVYGDLTVTDTKANKVVLEEKNYRLLNIPYYTNRYTMIVDGNEYAVVNQLRLKPGIYTRKRENEDIESSFNLAKGANFKLVMQPETGKFSVVMLGSTMPMYSVLKILGAPDSVIQSALGDKLFAVNKAVTNTRDESVVNTLYAKVAMYKTALGSLATRAEKEQKIREYFSTTRLDPETTHITIGKAVDSVTYDAILAAATKILKIYNQAGEIDERDNLEFQKIHSVEDLLKEVLEKNNDAVAKITMKLKAFKPTGNREEDLGTIRSIINPGYFTKPIRNFITTSSISRLPTQINPLEMLDTASIITKMGEGAIQSDQAVPDETRAVNYSYMGVIDPVAAPESIKIGVDNRATIEARKGDDNEIYRVLKNCKTGKIEERKLIETSDKYVGFPDSGFVVPKPDDLVPAIYKGRLVKVKRSALDYQLPSPRSLSTTTISMLPMYSANQANRVVMSAKHVQQALPLKDRDTRLVEGKLPASPHVEANLVSSQVGGFLSPKAPVDGEVIKIDDDFIYIKGVDGKKYEVDYEHHLPLATKTFLHNTITVKVGDKVKKDQLLADNNFTKDGRLALGRNLTVAYMAYHGLNHEDGIVLSESAAHKMTSVHADKIMVDIDKTRTLNRDKYALFFPTNFSKEQLGKVDPDGVVKKGTVLHDGDPIVLILEDSSDSKTNQVLGMLHRSLMTKYRDASEVYHGAKPATVLDVHKTGTSVAVLLEIEKPVEVGDKISGSHGNKGVCAAIIPDDHMPKTKDGEVIDALLTPVGVPGRINPAQIHESALGKVAKKTGKIYEIEHFSHPNLVEFVKGELNKHGVSEKETVIDPMTGKEIPDIFVGVQHMHKLFKTTDSNFSARNIEGPHDMDDAPTGSGDIGPKALGGMEVNAMLANNARNFLRESTMIRAGKNLEFWRAFKDGRMPTMPVEKKTFNRFGHILRQAGIKMDKRGDVISVGPLTDKDILDASSGAITNERRLDAKLRPETGGLFDIAKTGGLGGTKWSHVELTEPLLNPVFEDCAKTLLGYTTAELTAFIKEHGGAELRKRLNAIDVAGELKNTEAALSNPKLKGPALDKQVKKLKYLRVLADRGLKAGEAYTLSVYPVIPPVSRPITVGKTGDTMENDANLLYQNMIMLNNSFKRIKDAKLPEEIKENRQVMYNAVKELSGVMDPNNPHMSNKGVKGAIAFIAGSGMQPKHGYFQRKVIYSKQNLSGRATIIPDPTLGFDEVGLPEDIAWGMYKPFIIRRLTQLGYSAIAARDQVEKKTDIAKRALDDEMAHRPVVINRAPTLWRHSIFAVTPVLRSGKNLAINSLWEKGLNADHDGDAMQIHLPVTDEAVRELKEVMPSKMVFSDKARDSILSIPTNEPVAALYKVTSNVGSSGGGVVKKYKTEADAWKAYYAGELKATDLVEIGE